MPIVTTKNSNPVKKFGYAIEMDGVVQALAQSVKIGALEIAVDLHGDGNQDYGTPGKIKKGDITIKSMIAQDLPGEATFWDWMQLCQNMRTGTGALPETVDQTFLVHVLNSAKIPVRTYMITGWPKKIELDELGDKEEGNALEEVVLHCNDIDRLL